MVRDQSRRQHRAEGQERRLPDLRRPVLLRRLRVRRSESRRRFARRSPITTTSAATAPTTAASSSTRATTATPPCCSSSTPRDVQYDAVTDDASGEDSSPDFFWDSAARITDHGWTLEMRMPFSSLRYKSADPQTWGILLYRNYPRAFRYQIFSAKLPRGGNCFICRANTLDRTRAAARRRPSRGRAVRERERGGAAARRRSARRSVGEPVKPRVGVDVKWTPNADNGDRPDGQPGFLAGRIRHRADFRERAVRAVLSREAAVLPRRRRSVSDADPGGVHADDHRAAVGRPRHRQERRRPLHRARRRRRRRRQRDAAGPERIVSRRRTSDRRCSSRARSATSACRSSACSSPIARRTTATGTTASSAPTFSGGRRATTRDRAVAVQQHADAEPAGPRRRVDRPVAHGQRRGSCTGTTTRRISTALRPYKDIGDDFRADTGFVPQVGLSRRRTRYAAGRCDRTDSCRGVGTFVDLDHQADPTGGAHQPRSVEPGVGMDTRWNGFMQFRYHRRSPRAGERRSIDGGSSATSRSSARRAASRYSASTARSGEEIDFANSRPGTARR